MYGYNEEFLGCEKNVRGYHSLLTVLANAFANTEFFALILLPIVGYYLKKTEAKKQDPDIELQVAQPAFGSHRDDLVLQYLRQRSIFGMCLFGDVVAVRNALALFERL